nr:2Fe-2S iron-sulfur cluster binding domain-containing protein [Clostridia bacterium]
MGCADKLARITVDGVVKTAAVGTVLAKVLEMDMPCGGHGRCGKCKVRASGMLSPMSESERGHLSADEIASDIRLACCTVIEGDCTVFTSGGHDAVNERKKQIVTSGAMRQVDVKPRFTKYGAAVDIGTTTLAARLYDTDGNLLSEVSALNPQAVLGADVVTRIEAALKGESDRL